MAVVRPARAFERQRWLTIVCCTTVMLSPIALFIAPMVPAATSPPVSLTKIAPE